MQVTENEIQSSMINVLKDMIQDWDLEIDEIRPETKLVADLNFSSIDFIHLVVSTEEHFKQKLGFDQFIMQNGKYVDDLSVSELVTFVTRKVRGE